jgi:hypothetical protein
MRMHPHHCRQGPASRARTGWPVVIVILGLLLTPWLVAQMDSSVAGTVTDKEGKPIAGVSVSGGRSKTRPEKREHASTDQNGKFRIEHPEGILHFFKDKLQPKTVVLASEKSPLQITLEPATDNLVAPVCGKLARRHKRIGWAKYGLHFDVAERTVEILGGKPDVDYAHYVIKPRKSESSVELWFGAYAIDTVPDDDEFIHSNQFAERTVVDAAGGWLGMDSWGRKGDGGTWLTWRHMAILGQGGAIYENVPAEQASLLDHIVNSLCEVPYPRR